MTTKNNEKDGVNIQVILRCRPTNKEEHSQETVVKTNSKEVNVTQKQVYGKPISKCFTFDQVYGPGTTQKELFESIKPLIDEVLMGYNCTIFAYGQTSTGKTYTMEGRRNERHELIQNEEGVVPRTVDYIFEHLKRVNAEYTIRLSCLELYNEDLQDLLANEKRTLRLYDDPNGRGTTINGLEEVVVKDIKDLLQILDIAAKKRQVGETQLNKSSSRSHVITTMTIHVKEQTPDGEELIKTGKLYLVDLAGSENIGRSGALKKRAQETGMINQSLLTLGRVITALTENSPHIPYRESKLTRLLQDSLGGHTKTCIITTISPSILCLEETLSTLEYARRAKTIKNQPELNMKMTKNTLLKDMTGEIDALKLELTASRLKNGVYLPLETFNEKMQMIEKQGAQIEALEIELDLHKKKAKELREHYDTCKQDLATEIKHHTQCRIDYGATTLKLKDVEEELEGKVQELAKTRYVLAETKKSENILYHEAETLLHTVDECVVDFDLVHTKLEDFEEVTSLNNISTSRFKESVSHKSKILDENMSKLAQSYNKMTEATCASLDQFRIDKKVQLEAFTKEIQQLQTLLEGSVHQINEMVKSRANESDLIHSDSISRHETLEKSICEKIQVSMNAIITFSGKMNTLIKNQEDIVEKSSSFNRTTAEKGRQLISSFSSTFDSLIKAFTTKMEEMHQIHVTDVKNNQQILRQSENIQSTRLATSKTEIMTQIQSILEAANEKELREARLISSVIQDSFGKSNSSLDKFKEEGLSSISTMKVEKDKFVSDSSDWNVQTLFQQDVNAKSFQESIKDIDNSQSQFTTMAGFINQSVGTILTDATKSHATQMKEETSKTSEFSAIMRTKTENITKSIKIHLDELEESRSDAMDNDIEFSEDLEGKEHKKHQSVTSINRSVVDHSKQTLDDLNSFVNGLKSVKTNNNTTKRKILTYPKILTKSKEEDTYQAPPEVAHEEKRESHVVKAEKLDIKMALSPKKKQNEPLGSKKSLVRNRSEQTLINKKKKTEKENFE